MTDRELLEAAAKAAGIDLKWMGEGVRAQCFDPSSEHEWWNPLTDDGDALRLAATLKIDLEWQNVGVWPEPMVEAYRREDVVCTTFDEHERDYRRAIVRAAAALGATP